MTGNEQCPCILQATPFLSNRDLQKIVLRSSVCIDIVNKDSWVVSVASHVALLAH